MKFLYVLVILSANVLFTFASDSEEDNVDEEVNLWLNRIEEFGKDWEKNTEDQPQFSNDWKEMVEKQLHDIKEVLQSMFKDKGDNGADPENKQRKVDNKPWTEIIKEKLESIQKFGMEWKDKVAEKFRSKFKRDWNKHVQNSLSKLKEVDDKVKKKVQSIWKNIKNFGKDTFGGNKLEKLKMTQEFPLPLDLDGVVVTYHKSKICVNQKGKEKCANKHDKPGRNSEVEKLFRVIHEFEKLSKNVDGGGGGSDVSDDDDGSDDGGDVDKGNSNGDGSNEYKKFDSDYEDK